MSILAFLVGGVSSYKFTIYKKNPTRTITLLEENPFKNKLDKKTGFLSLKLPYDYPKVSESNVGRKSIVNFSFDDHAQQFLKSQTSDKAGKFLVTAFVALLYRYTGQAQIPLTLYIFDQDVKRININVHTSGNISFETLYQGISNKISDGANSGMSANQVQIVIRNKKNNSGNGGNHRLETDQLPKEMHQPDLHLEINNEGKSPVYSLLYKGNLFDRKTIQRIGRHYHDLLASVIESGNKLKISEVNLFSAFEANWYEEIRTGGSFDFPSLPLHNEIEKFAREQPDKTAVFYKDSSITYGELNQLANQLAHFLHEHKSIGAGSRVIVCLTPSVDIAIALLAILKIGAIYVPLNPSHPEYRIQSILKDTHPEVVLVHGSIIGLHDFGDIPTFMMDDPRSLVELPQTNPNIEVLPNQTAYIYYTSGTTGAPKGSLGSYANLNHYIRVAQEKYDINSSDIMPALASYTFSISMFELLSPLVAGGTLTIVDRQQILDVENMAQMLQEVTFVHAGPSLLKTLVGYINRSIDDYSVFKGLRHLSSGGDMVPPDLLRKLQLIFPHTELYVIYGCSEIGCMGATYPVDPVRPLQRTLVGKPFKNVSILVLDKDSNMVPIGVAGEVCIGGNGVAAGYLGNPQLTDEKFIVRQGTRFYRTGDVGRLNEEGDLELLGREDFQIQIHGMRVELGEVEYHMRHFPAVKDAVVIAKKNGTVDNTLVAFYVKKENFQVHSESLRQHMMQHVPDYMVPSYYVELETLPLNVNMKVDRKVLQTQDVKIADPIVYPQSQSEKELAAIWVDLLRNRKIGLHDNFLAIGGDSLLAMEMISKVRESMGVKLDGLSVLRESLKVLASICDTQLGRENTLESPDAVALQNITPVKSFFFGPDSSLYGLLHIREDRENKRAVLICPPIAGAYKRCYFLLKVFGDTLADAGIPVMRFDYYGTNDSLGHDRESTPNRWMEDVRNSYQELKRRTGAEIMVFGIRFGALLALKGLSGLPVSRWVLWDPIHNGFNYHQQLSAMQTKKVWRTKTLRGFNKPKKPDNGEELLGFTYSLQAIKELKELRDDDIEMTENVGVQLVHTMNLLNSEELGGWQQLFKVNMHHVEVNCDWLDPVELTTAITDQRIANVISKLFIEHSV